MAKSMADFFKKTKSTEKKEENEEKKDDKKSDKKNTKNSMLSWISDKKKDAK